MIIANMPMQAGSSIHTAGLVVPGSDTFKPSSVQPFSGLRLMRSLGLGLLALTNRAFAVTSLDSSSKFSSSLTQYDAYNKVCQTELAVLQANFESVINTNGVVTRGPLQDGALNGCGIKTYPTGGTDAGLFEQGLFVTGKRTYPKNDDGTIKVLTGSFVNDELEGNDCSVQYFSANDETQLFYENKGTFHQGVFLTGQSVVACGIAEGKGVEACNTTDSGEFAEGLLIKGTRKYFDGFQATGNFGKDGYLLPGTRGTVVFPDGGRLEGKFNEYGKLDGEDCKTTYPDGVIEQGPCVNGTYVNSTHNSTEICPAGHYWKKVNDSGTTKSAVEAQTREVKTSEVSQQQANEPDPFDWTFGWKKALFG